MSRCWCGAGYADSDDCPRCSVDGATLADIIDEHALPFPPPDGPDDLLCLVAELEAQVARQRSTLEETGGARTCRYCKGLIPPGASAGAHAECLPEVLPDGARSCAGCAELILDDDDAFEHDFCPTPADETATEPYLVQDLFSAHFTVAGDEDDAPSLPETERVLRYSDAVLCGCKRWVKVELTAPPSARERGTISSIMTQCECGLDLTVAYSWRQGRFLAVKFGAQTLILN